MSRYLAWLALVVVALVVATWSSRGEEDAIPATGAVPMPGIARVEGLSIEATTALPAWRADLAEPASGGDVLAVAGVVSHLALTGVRVALDDDAALSADGGTFDGATLSVAGAVRVHVDGAVALIAANARLGDGGIEFPGLAVLRPGSPRERTVFAHRCGWRELIASLR